MNSIDEIFCTSHAIVVNFIKKSTNDLLVYLIDIVKEFFVETFFKILLIEHVWDTIVHGSCMQLCWVETRNRKKLSIIICISTPLWSYGFHHTWLKNVFVVSSDLHNSKMWEQIIWSTRVKIETFINIDFSMVELSSNAKVWILIPTRLKKST